MAKVKVKTKPAEPPADYAKAHKEYTALAQKVSDQGGTDRELMRQKAAAFKVMHDLESQYGHQGTVLSDGRIISGPGVSPLAVGEVLSARTVPQAAAPAKA